MTYRKDQVLPKMALVEPSSHRRSGTMPKCLCGNPNANKQCAVGHSFHAGNPCEEGHVPWCDEMHAQIRSLHKQGFENPVIAAKVKLHLGEVARFVRSLDPDQQLTKEAEQVQGAIETTFGLERDLQMALLANLQQLERGLFVDGGEEYKVPSGRIDILAKDSHGTPVVIELKAGTADRDAIGQILSYMGDLQTDNPLKVRGIVVAGDFTPRRLLLREPQTSRCESTLLTSVLSR